MRLARCILGVLVPGALILSPATVVSISVEFPTRRVLLREVILRLENDAANHPEDAGIAFRLGRLHSLAYALHPDSVEVVSWPSNPRLDGRLAIYMADPIPFRPFPQMSDKHSDPGNHLGQAISAYERALRLGSSEAIVNLGYAWCLEASGRITDAANQCREAIRKDFELMQKHQSDHAVMPPNKEVTLEAIGLLMRILDPIRDQNELSQLETVQAEVRARWPSLQW
jgi:tetratricopeptide (TPR) repeat protein